MEFETFCDIYCKSSSLQLGMGVVSSLQLGMGVASSLQLGMGVASSLQLGMGVALPLQLGMGVASSLPGIATGGYLVYGTHLNENYQFMIGQMGVALK